MREQTFTVGTRLNPLAFSSFAQNNTLDEYGYNYYIINFFILKTFSKVSRKCNSNSIGWKTNAFLTTNKNHTHSIQKIKVYYARHAIKHYLIQESKGKGGWKESRNVLPLCQVYCYNNILALFNHLVIELYEEDNIKRTTNLILVNSFVYWALDRMIRISFKKQTECYCLHITHNTWIL